MKKINSFVIFLFSVNILLADIICDRCGGANPDNSMFCQDCGARLIKSSKTEKMSENFTELPKEQKKICPSCKTVNSLSANFCQNCGTKLPESIDSSALKHNKKDTTKFTKAIILSALFPGVGHIYLAEKNEKIKGIILTSSSVGLLISSLLVWNYAEERYSEYEATKDDFAYDDYSTSIDIANFLLVTLGAVWVYNLVDIYITTSKLKKVAIYKDIKKDFNIYVNFSSDRFKICITKKI